MHEYSIVSALLDRIEEEARSRRARAVARVQVRLGGLSGVEPDLLATAFEMARAGTICGEAHLEIVRSEVKWTCPSCGRPLSRGGGRCPECDLPPRLDGSDEIILERLELEVT